jgi:hypothetical protein
LASSGFSVIGGHGGIPKTGMISVLIPTRKRGGWLTRMVQSMRATRTGDVEAIVYIDDDDLSSVEVARMLGIKHKVGPRIVLSACWDELLPLASGEIFMQGNDDIIFRTPGWDRQVETAFVHCPDRILLVHGDDGAWFEGKYGTHCCVHRRWIDAVGFFIAPWFSSDYGDTFLNWCADQLGRRRKLPYLVEHMHFSLGKADIDQTTSERLERHARDNPEALYEKLLPARLTAVDKLRKAMRTIPA